MTTSNAFKERRATRLGATDLVACRIGIGCGSGLLGRDLEYAVSRGVNYIFQSSDFHAVTYGNSWESIRRVWGGSSSRRAEIVFVGCSYVCDPEKIIGVVLDQLLAWNLDYLDVFQWGWVTKRNDLGELTETSRALTDPQNEKLASIVRHITTAAAHVQGELRSHGYARYVGISTHDRDIARQIITTSAADLLMLRYNIAHRGAESEVFAHATETRPGTVAFNVGHNGSHLAARPAGLPEGKYVPTQQDLYRWALDNPSVDVVLAGPANRQEIDAAIGALDRPPLEPALYEYLNKLGDLHAGRTRVATV